MGAGGQGQRAAEGHVWSRVIHLDDAWSQPLGPLDLLALELRGATLRPDFSPTVTQYEAVAEAFPHTDASAGGSPAGVARVLTGMLVVELAVTSAWRGTPVQVTSSTGRVEPLGRGRYVVRGRAGGDHHLAVTVGSMSGPCRSTVIMLRGRPGAIR